MNPLSFKGHTRLSLDYAPIILSLAEVLLIARKRWEGWKDDPADVSLYHVNLADVLGTHNFQVLATLKTHVKYGVCVIQDSTGFVEAQIERCADVSCFTQSYQISQQL